MNSVIATGHIMRCLSIAEGIRACGDDATFILADENAVPLLRERGYQYIVLGSKWDNLEEELPVLASVVNARKIQVLLVDHYYVTEKYLSELQKHIFIAYIDDINAFYYPVDMLICYANYYEKFKYDNTYRNRDIRTELLLGTHYAPLRSKFHNCEKKIIRKTVRSLLIMSGGADTYGVIRKILSGLKSSEYESIYAICGVYNADFERLAEKYKLCSKVKILKSVPDIDKYMKIADLSISAAGSTLYELCAVGTPAISYTIADNQQDNAWKFQEDEIIAYAGDMRSNGTIDRILEMLNGKLQSQDYRSYISHKMQCLVDGKGALRIAKNL